MGSVAVLLAAAAFAQVDAGTPAGARLQPKATQASSSIGPAYGLTFAPANATDGDLTTSWQPKKATGAWLELGFTGPVTLTAVRVGNGFQRSDAKLGDLFELNGRLKRATVSFSSGAPVTLDFGASARGLLTFPLPGVVTNRLRLTVDEVHPGSRWPDLAVSELEAWGPGPAEEDDGAAGDPLAGLEKLPGLWLSLDVDRKTGKKTVFREYCDFDGYEELSLERHRAGWTLARSSGRNRRELRPGSRWTVTSVATQGAQYTLSLEGRAPLVVVWPTGAPDVVTVGGKPYATRRAAFPVESGHCEAY